ncbi:hypothetical protein HZA39_02845 [Candidatus Peregrinibacteria bacterium]|nr:hypothetical protein [Candidatus Peregrinibacteria bacterium]
MENKNFENPFRPARLVFFAGETGGSTEQPEKKEVKEAVEKFEKKFEAAQILDSQNIEKAYDEATKKIDEACEKAGAFLPESSEERKGLQEFTFKELQRLDDLKDKYTQLAEKNKEEFEKKQGEAREAADEVWEFPEMKIKADPERYAKREGDTLYIDFKGDKEAEKKVRLTDIITDVGAGDKYLIYHKGKEILATYDAKKNDFVDDRGKHAPISSGDKVEKVEAVAMGVDLGEKKARKVEDLSSKIFGEEKVAEKKIAAKKEPKEKIGIDPELLKYRNKAVDKLKAAKNDFLGRASEKYNESDAARKEYIGNAVEKEEDVLNKAIEEVKASPDLAEMLINGKDIGENLESLKLAGEYIKNPAGTAGRRFTEIMQKYDKETKLAKKGDELTDNPLLAKKPPEGSGAKLKTLSTTELKDIETGKVEPGPEKKDISMEPEKEGEKIAKKTEDPLVF